jgi:hypothetical protein
MLSMFGASNHFAQFRYLFFGFLCASAGAILLFTIVKEFDGAATETNGITFRDVSRAMRKNAEGTSDLSTWLQVEPWETARAARADGEIDHRLGNCIVQRTSETTSVVACAMSRVERQKLAAKPKGLDDSGESVVTDIVFDRINNAVEQLPGASLKPRNHDLIYHDVGTVNACEFDFVVDKNGDVHVILVEETSLGRVVYVRGSLKEQKWYRSGFILATDPQTRSPRVSALLDANGEVHLFWVEPNGNKERLVHLRADSLLDEIVCESLGSAESLSYRVITLSNQEICIICKAYNCEFYQPEWANFRVGGDFSLNLRVLQEQESSRWKRLTCLSADGVPRPRFALRNLDLAKCAIHEVSKSGVELRFGGQEVMRLEYSVSE